MQRLPPLTELRAFEAAARHLSFRLAAEELGVTPTAVSHQIRLLEQFCGRPLFRRRPRPLTLTDAGVQLIPVIRDGLDRFGVALGQIRDDAKSDRLRVTATNGFAARWLLPRLPEWRRLHPKTHLAVDGTDTVLDIAAGEADIAIRYARLPPAGLASTKLGTDTYHVVASPKLVGRKHCDLSPVELARFPLIECEWPAKINNPPTWTTWETAARTRYGACPSLSRLVSLSFVEELHGIEAAIAGQGIVICGDVLTARELADGTLRRLSPVTLPGFGFFAVHRIQHPQVKQIAKFVAWAAAAMRESDAA